MSDICGKDLGGHQPCYLPINHTELCLGCHCNMGTYGPSKAFRGVHHKVFCPLYIEDHYGEQFFFQEIWDTTR